MLIVDFKLIGYWKKTPLLVKYDASTQVSSRDVEPGELLEWFQNGEGYLQCGYTIEIDGKPWNGYFDEEIQEDTYAIDHFGGAVSFLRAVEGVAGGSPKKGKTRTGIWQVDSSTMRLEYRPVNQLILEDEAYRYEAVLVNWEEFLEGCLKATSEFLELMDKVRQIASPETQNKLRQTFSEVENLRRTYLKLTT